MHLGCFGSQVLSAFLTCKYPLSSHPMGGLLAGNGVAVELSPSLIAALFNITGYSVHSVILKCPIYCDLRTTVGTTSHTNVYFFPQVYKIPITPPPSASPFSPAQPHQAPAPPSTHPTPPARMISCDSRDSARPSAPISRARAPGNCMGRPVRRLGRSVGGRRCSCRLGRR